MKIMLFIDSLEVGGAESHVEVLSSELLSMGHEIVVASAGGKICERLIEQKIKCIFLPQNLKNTKKSGDFSFVFHQIVLKKQIFRTLEREKPSIVHAHTRRTAFLLHQPCKKLKIPLIVTVHALFSMGFLKRALSKWGDGTIAVSDDIKNHLLNHGASCKSLTVIQNGVVLSNNRVTKDEKNNFCKST